MYHKDHVLVVPDLHQPFTHPGGLDFCLGIQKRVKCKTVVLIGDVVDNHSLSFFDHDPDGYSPKDEINEAKRRLRDWYKAFPEVFLCRGNHDSLVDRKGRHVGLPSEVFKPFREIWDLPKGWRDDWSWTIDGVLYKHGTGLSGPNAHIKAATDSRMSTVIGHTHSTLAVNYLCSDSSRIFALNCGSLIDTRSYAFAYGKDFTKKPVSGCAVVTDRGAYAQVFPLENV